MARDFDRQSEGLAELNEKFRTYVEFGYELGMLDLDDKRVELISRFRDTYDWWQRGLANLERYEERVEFGCTNSDDEKYGSFEFRKELKDAKNRLLFWGKQLRDIERTIDTFFAKPVAVNSDTESEWCVMCKAEQPDQYKACQKARTTNSYESRRMHYQGAHDAALDKERRIRRALTRTTEEQDKKLLKTLDFMKSGRWEGKVHKVGMVITGPWYYKLSMLVIRKHVDLRAVAEFSLLSKEEKKKARKDPKLFWIAACDRMSNFRKVNEAKAEANGREWKLPTNDYSLEVMEVSLTNEEGEEIGDGSTTGNYRISEDSLIALIDKKSEWFIKRVMRRVSLTRAVRKNFNRAKRDWESIKNSRKEN